MQRLCASNVDVPVGRIVYTLLCNERGGIEMDPTVTRLGEDRFLVLAPTLAQRHTEMLLRNGLPAGATVTDVTSGWATLHLAGPRSRELLGRLTDEDLSNEGFPFLTAREIEAGRAKAWAYRVSFTGELGWELSVPTEFVADLYDHVVAAGADLGLRHAGAFAFDAARIERGFRSWGHDIGPLDDPYQSGLGFAVHLKKDADFVGREALERLLRGAARAPPRLVARARRGALARRVPRARRRTARPSHERGGSRRRWVGRPASRGSHGDARAATAGASRSAARSCPPGCRRLPFLRSEGRAAPELSMPRGRGRRGRVVGGGVPRTRLGR